MKASTISIFVFSVFAGWAVYATYGNSMVLAIGAGIYAFLYLLPTLIASERHAKNSSAIFLINLLLGWTVIGWFAALLWAVCDMAES